MGYSTTFDGFFAITPALTPDQVHYLQRFRETRRYCRVPDIALRLPDPARARVGLPIGDEGGYFVGGRGFRGQDDDPSTLDYNCPPRGQPGLWCQWTVTSDGTQLVWDKGEKFYDYREWLTYLLEHFFRPWGRSVSGTVRYAGAQLGDVGDIVLQNNVLSERDQPAVDAEGPTLTVTIPVRWLAGFERMDGEAIAQLLLSTSQAQRPENQLHLTPEEHAKLEALIADPPPPTQALVDLFRSEPRPPTEPSPAFVARLREMDAVSGNATPGPWKHVAGLLKHYVASADAKEDLGLSLQSLHPIDGHTVPAEANARHIAQTNPTVFRAILDVLQAGCGVFSALPASVRAAYGKLADALELDERFTFPEDPRDLEAWIAAGAPIVDGRAVVPSRGRT